MPTVDSIVSEFMDQITESVEAEAMERARAAVLSAIGGATPPRRPNGQRRGRARLVCLAPGCTNAGAPLFGMVCADHKGLPKRVIAKYRERRRAERLARRS